MDAETTSLVTVPNMRCPPELHKLARCAAPGDEIAVSYGANLFWEKTTAASATRNVEWLEDSVTRLVQEKGPTVASINIGDQVSSWDTDAYSDDGGTTQWDRNDLVADYRARAHRAEQVMFAAVNLAMSSAEKLAEKAGSLLDSHAKSHKETISALKDIATAGGNKPDSKEVAIAKLEAKTSNERIEFLEKLGMSFMGDNKAAVKHADAKEAEHAKPAADASTEKPEAEDTDASLTQQSARALLVALSDEERAAVLATEEGKALNEARTEGDLLAACELLIELIKSGGLKLAPATIVQLKEAYDLLRAE